MDLSQMLLVLLSGLGVFHGLFSAMVLWKMKTPLYAANRLLSVLMVLLSVRIGKSVVMEFSDGVGTVFIYAGLSLLLFIGPLFFLYCRMVVHKQAALNKKDAAHFIPGLLFLLLAIPFQAMGFQNLPDPFVVALFVIFYGHYLAYLLLAKRNFIRNASATSKEAASWLNTLFAGLLAVWAVYVLNLFEESVPYIIGPVCYSITVYTITYLALSRDYIRAVSSIKYQTTALAASDIDPIYASIEKAMQDQQLFLNPDFSLALLARQLKLSTQKISRVINSKAGGNFNEYVNRYRVQHAVRLMEDPRSSAHTIASIAVDAGFNSLSSFNHSFKKHTGKTPSAFRARRSESSSALTE